ncbi:arginase [Candidatus Parcubacteria bacterium]|nr:MAG: arginase [Candidatus Parcubacteria bacterium]
MKQNQDRLSFYEPKENGSPVTLLSIPLELGSDERGLAESPKYLEQNGLLKMFPAIGREVRERRSIFCPKPKGIVSAGSMKNLEEVMSVARRTKAATEKARKRGDTVIALGGDHSIALGTIAGAAAAHESVGLIYIDAHPDCVTDTTTISGNIHGMIVSTATGQGNPLMTDVFTRTVKPDNVLYVAIKEIDQPEISLIRESGIHYFTMLDMVMDGLSPLKQAIDELSKRVDHVWVSLDLDSIDARFAPGVAMTNIDGLTRREIMSLAHYIGKVCNVAGVDIVEMVPAKDREALTAKLVIEVLARFLGGQYGWYEQYMEHYASTNVTKEPEKVRVRRA